nr:TniB family NTP-binding protein [Sinorhizobium meliloti]
MAHLRDCGWVFYPRAKQALDRLNRLLDHPRGTRMPSVAIYGDSGMRKTMIMKRFRDQHPPTFNSLRGTLRTPVLAMEMTSRPGERRFYAELLTLLGAPKRPRADNAQMEQAALRIMEAIGVQVLMIDEVHNILAGTYREQRMSPTLCVFSAIVFGSHSFASASTKRVKPSAATCSWLAGSSNSR